MCHNRISALWSTLTLKIKSNAECKLISCKSVYRWLAFSLLCTLASTASFADVSSPTTQTLETQIEFIDQEILLLRAELARTNRDTSALKRYMRQLEGLTLAPAFLERLAALEQFLNSMSMSEQEQLSDSAHFRQPFDGSQVVVLLPLSGDYEAAGQAILESLTVAWPFNKAFTTIDSGLYSSMYELWELVKLYQPDFIIGPLTKDNALAWQTLDVPIPTLYLNQLDTYKVNEKGLSPNKTLGLSQLSAFTDALALDNVLVLSEPTKGGKELQLEFEQAWLKSPIHRVYEAHSTERGVHQTMQIAFNVNDSYARKNWVQKTVGRTLEFEPRARQDIEAVIALSPMSDAVQIKPILDFYHLNRTMSLWYPSTYPSASELKAQQSDWQQTYAFLPPYLVDKIAFSDDDEQRALKTGLFHALGLLVAETVKNPRLGLLNQGVAESALGTLITDKEGRLTILPHVFWLDDKQIQPVNEYQYSFD